MKGTATSPETSDTVFKLFVTAYIELDFLQQFHVFLECMRLQESSCEGTVWGLVHCYRKTRKIHVLGSDQSNGKL